MEDCSASESAGRPSYGSAHCGEMVCVESRRTASRCLAKTRLSNVLISTQGLGPKQSQAADAAAPFVLVIRYAPRGTAEFRQSGVPVLGNFVKA